MLSIGAMVRGQGHYYTQLGREDYYLEGGEPPGYWRGGGAEALRLTGQIEPDQLHNIFNGYAADGKSKLVQNAGARRRQPGLDLTFSAEKDVSVLWAMADADTRQQIEAVQRKAVDTALEYLEREAGWTRKDQGGQSVERARLLFACFEHGTSRAQDPNLHTHCLALNVCVADDGKTRAMRNKDLYHHKMTAGALYRAEMSYLLRENLGLVTRATGDGFYRIEGASDNLREAFSKRREKIEKELEEKGFSTAAAAALASERTRHKKGHLSRNELDAMWRQEAKDLGYTPERLLASVRDRLDTERAPDLAKTVKQQAEELSKTRAWFRERDLVRAVAEKCQGGWFKAEQIQKSVREHLGSDRTLDLGTRGEYREFTDQGYFLLTERSLFTVAEELAGRRFHTVRKETLHETKVRFGGVLNDEQRKAVDHLVGEPGSLKLLSGLAGTGKTTTLRACAEAWRADGYKVVGAALAGKAARELQDGAGIQSETLRKREMQIDPSLGDRMWHHAVQLYRAARKWDTRRLDRLKLDSKSVLVIDEAGMLGAQDTLSMLRKAKKAGAKVVLVGDERQLPAIESVSAFKALQDRHGAAQLKDVMRQRTPWMREAVQAFAEGDSRTGLSLLNEHERLHLEGRSRKATMKSLVDKWAEKCPTASDVANSVILAGTRHDAKRLNKLAQETRRERGELGRFWLRLGVEEGESKRHADRAYRGDRVMFLKNNRSLGVYNGETGTVKRVLATGLERGRLWVEKDNGKTIQIDLSKYDQLALGYAATTHKLQGATVEQAFVYTNARDAAREMSYVQASRHRGDIHVFLPGHSRDEDFRELQNAMEKSKQHELAEQREHDEALRALQQQHEDGRGLERTW